MPDYPKNMVQLMNLNLEMKRIFRIAEHIVIFATKMSFPDIVDFVKRTFHPDFNVSTLKDIKDSFGKKDVFKNMDIYG